MHLARLPTRLFVCFLYGYAFLSDGKGRGMKFCIRVDLLSGLVFSPCDETWLAGSHGGGITLGMSHFSLVQQLDAEVSGRGSWNWGRQRVLRPYGGMYVLQACLRTSLG